MGWLQRLANKLGLSLSFVPTNGPCGARALHAVYQRLRVRSSLAEIWKRVRTAKEGSPPGRECSSGPFMCRHALERSLHAIYFDAKYTLALDVVADARERGVQVIIVHGTDDPNERHCSIVDSAAPEGAELYDPLKGATPMSPENFLDLWGRIGEEGGGHFLLAISPEGRASAPCARCGLDLPSEIRCDDAACGRTIPLGLGWMLGCLNRECPAATWESVGCPFCQAHLTELRSWNSS